MASDEILEIRQGRTYVKIPREKGDIKLIQKILGIFEQVEEKKQGEQDEN